MSQPPAPWNVGYLPLLRHGDMIFNLIVMRRHFCERSSRSRAVLDIVGSQTNGGLNFYACDLRKMPTRIFGGNVSVRDILFRHTLFGVYARAATEAAVSDYIAKQGRRGIVSDRAFGPGRRFQLSSRRLRSCPECIEADRDAQGFPTWRVLHQVAALDRCPEHGATLIEELPPSGNACDRMWALQLPSGVQSDIDRTTRSLAIPVSDGYAAYLALWRRLMKDELLAVRPEPWLALIRKLTHTCGGAVEARRAIEAEVSSSWGLLPPTLAVQLHLTGGASFISEELAYRTRPTDISRRLIIYAAATQMGIGVGDETQLTLKLGPRGQRRTRVETNAYTEIWSLVNRGGMPIALAEALQQDITAYCVGHIAGLPEMDTRHFIRALPTDLLLDLVDSQPWGAMSWLRRELRRRKNEQAHA